MKVKIKILDVEGQPVREFEFEHAQKMLNIKHPIKTLKLEDDRYTFTNGVLAPIVTEEKTKGNK